MKRLKFKLVTIFLLFILVCSGISVVGFNDIDNNKISLQTSDNFYFVHLTDTHIKHRIFDRTGLTKKGLSTVIEHVLSFEEKPAFIVITGDLTEWAGIQISGALNCIAFANCFYEKDDQLYADAECSIPVYTTPGNHDHSYTRSLWNYHRFIDKKHITEKDRYIVTYGDMSLFFLDSGPNYFLKPKFWDGIMGAGLFNCDIEWLENALSNCISPHKIVLMHHPAVNNRNENGRMIGVIARDREEFVELCESYEVDLVLAGHTHRAIVYDSDENIYEELPLNCSPYSTLHVQSDDCKQSIHYRNISIQGNDIWVEESVEINMSTSEQNSIMMTNRYIFMDIQKNIFHPTMMGERQS